MTQEQKFKLPNKLDRFFVLSDEILCVIGFDLIWFQVNPAFCLAAGVKEADFVGRPVAEFLKPEDMAQLRDCMARLKGGEKLTLNLSFPFEGELSAMSWSFIPDLQERCFYTTVRSVSSADLVRLREETRFILESMGIGVWRYNPVTNDLVWDQSMYDLFQVNAADFSGHYQAWESSLSPEAKQEAVRELQLALSGEKEFNTTFEILTKSGIRKQIGGRGVVLRDEEGRPNMMLGINWDRTREVQMEESLKKERAKTLHNAKLASLGEMSAGIAHEINNPLGIISGNIALFRRGCEDPEWLENRLGQMERAAARIEKIVKGLKKFSRTHERGAHRCHSLAKLVAESRDLMEPQAKRFSVQIETQVPEPLELVCDADEIEQVLVNLIGNAIYAVKNLPNKWVKVHAAEENGQIVLRVIDSGLGIPREVEEKLFQPFFTTKPIGEGTGIGLSIVRGILEGHRATIGLSSNFGNTCFEVRFFRR